MEIIYSKHSEEQNLKRRIPKQFVEITLNTPDKIQVDKYDPELVHYIKLIQDRYLRVIVKKLQDNNLVITYFYDRRLRGDTK